MIAGEEHVGNLHAPKLGRARILWVLQQTRREGVAQRRLRRPNDAGHQSSYRVDHHHRGKLAAAEHVVADADLVGRQVSANALVHTLVPTADEDEVPVPRQLLDHGLGQPSALGGHQHHRRVRAKRRRFDDVFHGFEQGLGLKDHPRASAEGVVVGGTMAVVRVVADVVQPDFDQPLLASLADDAFGQGALEHLREEGQDVEAHRRR